MDTKNNPPQAQTLIGKLLDDFSALPVLWGLNEPGALVRHGDIFRIIVDAGKAFAAAPAPAQQPDAPSVYEAALRKLCDQLDGMKFTMFNMPGTGQNYSYWLREDASFYVEEARKVLDAPASSKPAGEVLIDDIRIARHAVFNLKEFRAGRTTFPGEALGILEGCLDRLASLATHSGAEVPSLDKLPLYKLVPGDAREWLAPSPDGHWYKADDVRALLAHSTKEVPSAMDADELTRLRRLMSALGHTDAFEMSDDYVRGVLCTTLGQAAGWIEQARLKGIASSEAREEKGQK